MIDIFLSTASTADNDDDDNDDDDDDDVDAVVVGSRRLEVIDI